MTWERPAFEEIRMDAEARGYGNWLEEEETACASASSDPPQAADSLSGTAAAGTAGERATAP